MTFRATDRSACNVVTQARNNSTKPLSPTGLNSRHVFVERDPMPWRGVYLLNLLRSRDRIASAMRLLRILG